jgi:hypothetical protein
MNHTPEIEELKAQLLNEQRLNAEYLLHWGNVYKSLRETGIDNVLRTDKDTSTYLKSLPLEMDVNIK